ncbi:S8 family peptidase [Lapillicoccus jejuensis]|uniref:Subtilase family protein n=1 Tax=Lapillicoccus jejuensis TaxID=402171 RepID=A0A542DZ70_9MICO|nr:S8 family serine peptidase [Lapillicoccus jejuensis]TQJ08385.1 subtilase family protein [Lapillicoccus jejuensis]
MRELVDAFAAVGVDVGVGGEDGDAGDRFDEMAFLYARGAVLTRDADVARVRRALGLDERPPAKDDGDERARRRRPGRGRERAGSSAGLTRIELDGRDTLEAVAELDRVLGPGVATPDHVLHVCPKGYACPATEPVPSDGPADPAPRDPALGTGVRVVVVDTGLVGELAQKVDVLAGVTGDEEDASAVGRYRGHGSFIAGIVKAMAPAAEVDVEAMLWVGGGILESDLAPALGRALESVPDVISLSAGATTRHGHPLLALEAFWEHGLRHVKGTVLVCAAGNNGDRGPFWPATSPWSVAVGALEPDGSRAPYSNHGSWVDVWARGSDLVAPYPVGAYTYAWPPHVGETASFGSGWASWSGTSFATPLVAGLVAARASWSGESARVAARSLVRAARAHATPYVGAVLEPGMADAP